MDSDDDSDFSSLASESLGTQSLLFTPFTPHISLRDSKSQTTLSLLSSILSTIISLGVPHWAVEDDENSTKIGEGATYCVERVDHTGQRNLPFFAIKRTKFTIPKAATKSYIEDPSLRRRINSVLLEIQVLSHPFLKNHPNFVHLLGYSWEETTAGYAPAIIVDLAEYGSLDGFVKSGISWVDKRILCDDIAVGLDALHACGIAHGDVKPENILVFKHPERRFIGKISDFEHALLGTGVLKYGGTPIYNAPEVHLQDHPSKKLLIPLKNFPFCDAFSFGLSVFEVFCDGRRYYESENTRLFRDLLTSFEYAKDELLDLALGFLKIEGFPPDILKVCWSIFEETLCFCPTDRLRGGWDRVRELIGAETLSLPAIDSNEPPPQSLKLIETEYSILSLYKDIFLDGETVRLEIVAELRHRSMQSFLPSEERANAAFHLSICSSIGFGQWANVQESADWLSQAALHGHEYSLILGTRILKANDLPIPDVFLYSPLTKDTRNSINFLEDLAPEDYYSNAVRILWGGEFRKLVLKPLNIEEDVVCVSPREGFLGWFNPHRRSRDPKALGKFIDRNFLLHHSAAVGDIEISRLLIESGATINLVNGTDQTPLYLGCRGGHAAIVKILLSKNADPSLCDNKCITPLHWVILFPEAEIEEIARLLVSQGANPDSPAPEKFRVYFDPLGLSLSSSPLRWACLCRNRFAVKVLLSLRTNPEPSISWYLLWDALSMLSADTAEILISTGNVLQDIHEKSHRKRLYSLIGIRIFGSFKRWVMHGEGYRQAYISCVNLLLHHGIPIGGSLLSAAKELNLRLTEALIAQGADVSERDPISGDTPLHLVLMYFIDRLRLHNLLGMMELLLKNGAPLEEDPGGNGRPRSKNLLITACIGDSPIEAIRLLLSYGADALVNSRSFKDTPLLTCHEDPRVTELLLEYGADPNLETLSHEIIYTDLEHDMEFKSCCLTAAGNALWKQQWEILKVLLDYGTTLAVGITGGHQQNLLHIAVARYYYRVGPSKHNLKAMENTARFFEMLLDHPVIQEAKLINASDWTGFTPLKYAIWFAIPRCTEILLSRGAQIDSVSPKTTPRMVVDEFYQNPPYFVHDEGVDEFNRDRCDSQTYRQSKSGYREELEKIILILETDSDKVLRLASGLMIRN